MPKKKAPKKTSKRSTKEKLKKRSFGGRPIKYKPEFCEQLYESLSQGYSVEASCAVIGEICEDGKPEGISKDTMYRWFREYPEFSYAKKRGIEEGRRMWETLGIRHITHYKDGVQLNSAVYCFNMKNRFGWSDKPEERSEESVKPFRLNYNLDDDDE